MNDLPVHDSADLLSRLPRVVAHELRTPLHSMSGWLHLLESRVPPDDPLAARALSGIRRSIEQQVELAELLATVGGVSTVPSGAGEDRLDRLAVWKETLAANRHWGRADRQVRTTAETLPVVAGSAQALAAALDVVLECLAARLDTTVAARAHFAVCGETCVLQLGDNAWLDDPLALHAVDGNLPPRQFLERLRARQTLAAHGILLQVPADVRSENRPDAQRWTYPAEHVRAANTRENNGGTRRRVLIVDDQPELREVLSALIEQRGDQPTAVSSAADALAHLARAEPFDVAILDIAMPDEDGLSLISRIRACERIRNLPAIALTAHASALLRRQALSAGFDVFLAKPVDPLLLFETIDRLGGR